MDASSRRVVGKRQVRPNQTRTDFGYVERSRSSLTKAKGKTKREDEEDMMNGPSEGRPVRSEKDARNLVA